MTMTTEDILEELESKGSEQTRKTYRRHGGLDPMFGVKFGDLGKLQKKVKVNQEVARELWESGILDAKVFATMIADPATIDEATVDTWVAEADNYGLTDAVAGVVARSPMAIEKMEQFMASEEEYTGRVGWCILSLLAKAENDLKDRFFERYITLIRRDIHSRQNRVRQGMNDALIAIGGRNENLREKALAAAAKIGKVEVDHGDTSCKTRMAEEYIEKIWERKRGK